MVFVLGFSVGACAQFHTITPHSNRYRVNAVRDKSVSASVAKVTPEASSYVSNGVGYGMAENVAVDVDCDKPVQIGVSGSCMYNGMDNVDVLEYGEGDNEMSTPSATSVADGMLTGVFSSTKGKTISFKVDSVRESLIRQYLAVAYPLRHIRVTSAFGMRRHPILHKRIPHNGIDLRARYEEVFSVLDGVVTAVGSDQRSGRYVSIRCMGGYSFSYCHLSQPLVKVGDSVRAGELIAISGNSGMSKGAHLHLGVRDATGQWLDPMVMLMFVQQTHNEVMQRLLSLQGLTEGDG